jgi:MFS family permease
MHGTVQNLTKNEPSAFFRWTVMVFISMAMFGNYYVYDSISPLADVMKAQLGFSDSSLGILNGIYSLPNIVMVLVGGIIIDRIGTKRSSLLFSLLCLIGTLMTTLSNGSFVMMAAGRLVFGLGAESLIVAVTTVLAKWFKGKELSLAFGLNLTIARLGTFAALNSPTLIKSLYSNWQWPLMVSTIFAVISVVSVVIYIGLDQKARKTFDLGDEAQQDKIVLSEIFSFNASFWYISLLCLLFYSAIFPFQTFAVKFFIEHHGVTREAAGFTSSIITLASMIGTPLFGLFIDIKGKRATLMIIGSAMLVPVYLLLVYTSLHPMIPMGIMGIAFSLVPAAMWPSVALIVKEEKLGTAYGLMTMIQNIGLSVFNFLIGFVNDWSAVDGVTNYAPGMWVFSITGVLGLVFAVLLRKEELGERHNGLELGNKDLDDKKVLKAA